MAAFKKYIPWLAITFFSFQASEPTHSFSHYHAPIYRGRMAPLVIKGNALAYQYRTIISNVYNSPGNTGLNFAGHYCLVYWTTSPPHQQSAVVDLRTGIVYRGVDAIFDYRFIANSRLLVVSPDPATGRSLGYKAVYWVWDEKDKKFEETN